ncbi:MAG: hypothetical protein KZQ74_00230 [gamma proteobacterium symbiont of Bathyaustriella thionipta]|nr:hypothetical protein [gamma proteobacterium symbiont of Bathyaustriella thionipta]MCU7965638.1 hypothetical protein [gamma proteobacterium symbiont of Bathyaustriella thionipta]
MMGMLVILSACQSNELTQQERLIQNAADAKTAATLFDYDLDNQASYNVHRDGSVIIKFDKSVQTNDYTAIVDTLRTIPEIHSVYATQGGRQVCPLQSIQK